MNTNQFSLGRWAVIVGVISVCLWGARRVEAQLTTVVWQVDMRGTLGIQGFDAKVMPQLESSKFKKTALLSMALGGTPSPQEVLAITIELLPDGTNMFLSVFNTATRENARITVNEQTTLFQDKGKVIFDVSADIDTNFPSSELRGGHVGISGSGKVVGGVPAQLKGNVSGFLVDLRPTDLNGTTGLLFRTTFKTSGKPLRALPAAGP